MLDGFDDMRRLGLTFDNVTLNPVGAIQMVASHANLALGPGPVNFRPAGTDVHINDVKAAAARPNSCEDKFVSFPAN